MDMDQEIQRTNKWSKTKWTLILLGIFDLILVVMHYTDYFFLFLKPTGYVIPLVINIIIIAVIGFRSRLPKIWTIIGLFLSIPIVLFHGFMVWILDNSYIKINSPYNEQSLIIEYRHATLGETTYFYNFYKTKLGVVGKHLGDQSISMMVPRRDHPAGNDAEGALGLNREEWMTENAVRFYTWKGMKDIYLNSSESFEIENTEEDIKEFIHMAKNKENGQTITINRNKLTIRYDEATDQDWLEITNENGKGTIPSQQCSRIVPNEERGYYMLEECTHQWEYPLYPMAERR